MAEACFSLSQATSPLLISFPHVGTEIPEELREKFVPRVFALEDTDWHVDRLYAFAADLGVSFLVSNYSRYVIDLNRPPDDAPMYGGANNTALCPLTFFSGDPLYQDGCSPSASEIAVRRAAYWEPYHNTLQAEIARIKSRFGYAILLDAHSIKSRVPWLFEGQLPDLNLGTAKGRSCAQNLRELLMATLESQTQFSHVTDARFSGGYITRQYGHPTGDVHAVQLEMAWRCYMNEEPPFKLDSQRTGTLTPILKNIVDALLSWKPL